MRLLTAIVASLFSLLLFAAEPADITPDQLQEAHDGSLLILDVRSDHEFDRGHVPGAIHIPHRQLASRLSELETWRQKQVVVYCESGYRANIAASMLSEQGFEKVYHLIGDMREWRNSGREIAF